MSVYWRGSDMKIQKNEMFNWRSRMSHFNPFCSREQVNFSCPLCLVFCSRLAVVHVPAVFALILLLYGIVIGTHVQVGLSLAVAEHPLLEIFISMNRANVLQAISTHLRNCERGAYKLYLTHGTSMTCLLSLYILII